MKVSVIIPVYNRFEFLNKTLNSMFSQTKQPDEVIIVNDGSKDDITPYILPYINRITLIENNFNKGVSYARNIGIKIAKNDWIAFLDSDDEWLPDKLEKQIKFHIDNSSVLFSHTFEIWIKNNKKVKYPKRLHKPKGWCFLDNLLTCKIAASSVMIQKKVFEHIGLFDENLRVCEDYDMWLRVASNFEIGLIEEELIIKNAGHTQLSDTIFAIDRYHIYSLEKFLNSKYGNEVKKMIERKCQILIKGAMKHNNQEILSIYSQKLESLKSL